MPEPKDRGPRVGAQRALDAFARARGGYSDRQTAMIYLLEALELDWTAIRDRDIERNPNDAEPLPTFAQLARAAGRLAAKS